MCLGTFSRRARSLATYFFFARVRIPRSAFCFTGNATQFPVKQKIESCRAGFSACGGSRSDKFCSATVRSTRSAFHFIGNATQFPIKQKERAVTYYSLSLIAKDLYFIKTYQILRKLRKTDYAFICFATSSAKFSCFFSMPSPVSKRTKLLIATLALFALATSSTYFATTCLPSSAFTYT